MDAGMSFCHSGPDRPSNTHVYLLLSALHSRGPPSTHGYSTIAYCLYVSFIFHLNYYIANIISILYELPVHFMLSCLVFRNKSWITGVALSVLNRRISWTNLMIYENVNSQLLNSQPRRSLANEKQRVLLVGFGLLGLTCSKNDFSSARRKE